MKEAIANTFVFNLVIIFVIVLLAFFIGSLSYSKAFKVKNRIVEEIEKDQGYTSETEKNIADWIRGNGIGYNVNTGNNRVDCPNVENGKKLPISDYQYCVYEFNTCSAKTDRAKCGKYYRVVTYMTFDFPIIDQLIKIPVTSETMTFNEIDS